MRDPMGILLMAGRVDPVLREATHAVEAELIELRALRDAIPGEDKRLVVEWAVEFARWNLICADKTLTFPERSHALRMVDRYMDCPPSVRAALRSSEGES